MVEDVVERENTLPSMVSTVESITMLGHGRTRSPVSGRELLRASRDC